MSDYPDSHLTMNSHVRTTGEPGVRERSPTSTAVPPADGAAEKPRRARFFTRPLFLVVLTIVILGAAVAGGRYWQHARQYESTDDAFIQGHIIPISPKVSAQVTRVLIDDNQDVKQGDVLVELDPRDFEVALAQAQTNEAAARGRLQQAQAQLTAAKAQVATNEAQVQQAQAQVEQAQLNLSYTKIYAPEDGRVTQKTVEPGAYVQPGQSLFALVSHTVWVVANFKETQLTAMRPGQPAEIEVDAYPHHPFKGHVDSFQSGTGAAFSLLPPENATGNYVKVVQRVPVKIVFDEPLDPKYLLAPGMSVVPEVKVR